MKDIFFKYIIEPIIKQFYLKQRNKIGFWIIIGIEFFIILLLPFNKFSGLKDVPESLSILQKPVTFIFSYPAYCKILFFIFIFILTYLIWLFRSGRLIIPSKKLKVAVALSPDNIVSDAILTKTLSMTNSKLKSLNLLDDIHIFKIGTDLFNTNKDAEKYLKSKKINLVIHGIIHCGKRENKDIFNLKDFSFSYYIPQVPRNTSSMNMIKKDINLMLTHRNWVVEESNSLSGSEAIATNFVEILLSIIGIASSFSKDYINTSVLLIEKLLPFLEKQIEPDKRKIEINRNKKKITMPISLLRSGRLRAILINCYLNISDLFFKDKEYKKIIEFTNKALKVGANKFYCYEKLAFSYYYLDDVKKAEFYTEELNKIKKQTPTYLVNKAFFSILRKDYKNSIDFYSLLRNKDVSEEWINNIISFLEDRCKEQPLELAFKYAIAILFYNHTDKQKGRKQLLDFKRCSANLGKYSLYNSKIDFILKNNQINKKINIKKKKKRKSKRKRKR